MSARSETDDIVAGFDIGAADYISKPLRMAEVCARVRVQLQLRSNSVGQQEQTHLLRFLAGQSTGQPQTVIGAFIAVRRIVKNEKGGSHGICSGRNL